MNNIRFVFTFALLLLAAPVLAHFAVILPSDDIVGQDESRILELQVKFIHPAEGQYMEMARPQRFALHRGGKPEDLLPALKAQSFQTADKETSFSYWRTAYQIRRPGDHTFFVEPTPYWEAAEDKFILHYTKVCVSAFGLEDSWDQPLGVETEILPLSRPYGLWTGNLFSAQVLLRGEPLPFAEIEVEYLNEAAEGGKLAFPADPFVTQSIKADARGVFHYALPKAGWWGFAALSDADWKLQKDGESKSVEIGALYWVKATDL
jgi:cobalt/nickel transport protein